jgi:membrane associated rhomboid family serine protease
VANLLLTWTAAGLFALVIFWGTNVPVKVRTPAVVWLVVLIVVFNIFTQTSFFRAEQNYMELKMSLPEAARASDSDLHRVLQRWAMSPGSLRAQPATEWYRAITSSLVHYGWLPLLVNVWYVVLFGHVLEALVGRTRFVIIAAMGVVVPGVLDGTFAPLLATQAQFTGGASGLVYALAGAAMVRFPRARFEVAVNLDPRFWGVVLLVLFPLSLFTSFAGLSLTETILMAGMAITFFMLQPVCRNLVAPLWAAIGFKLFLDIALMWPLTAGVLSNSVWRLAGGLGCGVVVTAALCGVGGVRARWHEDAPRKSRWKRHQPSLAELQARAESDPEAARRFLAQRVFVGDVARVLDFYPRVAREKYPDLVLPLTEQLALARMLQFKGRDADALHAYENLLRTYKLDENRWDAWLVTAQLMRKVEPQRVEAVREYLETFLRGTDILMRDRIEAEQMLAEMPGDAAVDGEREAREEEMPASVEPETAQAGGIGALEESSAKQGAEKQDEGETQWKKPLRPRTFQMDDAGAVGPPRRSTAIVREVLSPEEMARNYWKLLPMESGGRLDEEKILEFKTRGVKAQTPVESTGAYGAPGTAGSGGLRRPGGRLSNIQAIQRDFQPFGRTGNGPAEAADRAEKSPEGRQTPAANYGTGDSATSRAERPRIRLRRESGGAET